ncbi:MAG TPA: hypothetical protein ENF64_01150 [Hadesarchaea archaeon]|nr:hypothetical protein [Hadesarchaea archaeon]
MVFHPKKLVLGLVVLALLLFVTVGVYRANGASTRSVFLLQTYGQDMWGERCDFPLVVFDNRMWVLGGCTNPPPNPLSLYTNDVWYSTDGQNWYLAVDLAPWSPRQGHTAIAFDDKLWIFGGAIGYCKLTADIWCSEDGENWTLVTNSAPWGPRSGHTTLVFDNKLWIIGGVIGPNIRANDVWYSSDGVNWHQSTDNAGWVPRDSHQSVVFDDKMWIMGGCLPTGKGFKNDVWYSSDGVNWTQATASAGWAPRDAFTACCFDNRMWVMGGDADGRVADVWSSTDGKNWKLVTDSAPWGRRESHASTVFDGKIWVVGGNTDGGMLNDVWYFSGENWHEVPTAFGWRSFDFMHVRYPEIAEFGENIVITVKTDKPLGQLHYSGYMQKIYLVVDNRITHHNDFSSDPSFSEIFQPFPEISENTYQVSFTMPDHDLFLTVVAYATDNSVASGNFYIHKVGWESGGNSSDDAEEASDLGGPSDQWFLMQILYMAILAGLTVNVVYLWITVKRRTTSQ